MDKALKWWPSAVIALDLMHCLLGDLSQHLYILQNAK